jgi:EAL domain-containing protein (putative c-di-GMP-specific phosphodiesterase class I)
METEFNPLTTAHVDFELEEFPEIRLEADKFELWFQPVYELLTGRVLHNEVLVRWRDESGNLRQAQELLMVLQNTQLLGQLDLIVVKKSIEVMSKNIKIKVSINLSNEIFADRDFPDQLHRWLTQYHVAANRLSFEIEEISLQQHQIEAIALIEELQKIGCNTVIDNFTGQHFSLIQLQQLPFNIIKLDRSFASPSLSSVQKQMAMAIANISKIFQKQCVLKGIDNKYSLKFASDLGVKAVQGYSLSKPQDKPRTVALVGLLIVRIIALLILLYILKSILGIDLVKDHHAWEVIGDFIQSIFDGK